MKKYRIDTNIVDGHTMLTEALAIAINNSDVAYVSHTFTTLESCRKALHGRKPDVLLLGMSVSDGDVTSFCRQVIAENPKVKIIVITCHEEYSVIRRVLDSGVHGYVLKRSTLKELLDAIVSVYQGGKYFSRGIDEIVRNGPAKTVFLTVMEQNILQFICEGNTNPQIAGQLNLSTETVNWYRKRLLAKFGVKNTVNLVSLVLKERLL